MTTDDLKQEFGKTIFERLFAVRKQKDGWYTAALFLEGYILPSNEWASDPNIISALENAIRDIKAGIRQEKTSPDPRWSLVDEMKIVLSKLIDYLKSNGLGMLEVCK